MLHKKIWGVSNAKMTSVKKRENIIDLPTLGSSTLELCNRTYLKKIFCHKYFSSDRFKIGLPGGASQAGSRGKHPHLKHSFMHRTTQMIIQRRSDNNPPWCSGREFPDPMIKGGSVPGILICKGRYPRRSKKGFWPRSHWVS